MPIKTVAEVCESVKDRLNGYWGVSVAPYSGGKVLPSGLTQAWLPLLGGKAL